MLSEFGRVSHAAIRILKLNTSFYKVIIISIYLNFFILYIYMINYKKKYLKYKLKFEKLKQLGGEFKHDDFNTWYARNEEILNQLRDEHLGTLLNLEQIRRRKINLLVDNFAEIQTFNTFNKNYFYDSTNYPIEHTEQLQQVKTTSAKDMGIVPLKVMQFNIEHYGFTSNTISKTKAYNKNIIANDEGKSETTHQFKNRLDGLLRNIVKNMPDIIGLNEIGVFAYKYITNSLKDHYEIYVSGFPIHLTDYDNKEHMKEVLYNLSFNLSFDKKDINTLPGSGLDKSGPPLKSDFLLSFVDEVNDEYEIENMYFNVCLIKKNIKIMDATCYYFNNLRYVHRRNTLLTFKLKYNNLDFLWTHSHFIYSDESSAVYNSFEKTYKLNLLHYIVKNSTSPIIITGDFYYPQVKNGKLEQLGIEYNIDDKTYGSQWADCIGFKNFRSNNYLITFGNKTIIPRQGISDHDGLIYELKFLNQLSQSSYSAMSQAPGRLGVPGGLGLGSQQPPSGNSTQAIAPQQQEQRTPTIADRLSDLRQSVASPYYNNQRTPTIALEPQEQRTPTIAPEPQEQRTPTIARESQDLRRLVASPYYNNYGAMAEDPQQQEQRTPTIAPEPQEQRTPTIALEPQEQRTLSRVPQPIIQNYMFPDGTVKQLPEADPQAIEWLIGAGFKGIRIQNALQIQFNDLVKATEWLLENKNDPNIDVPLVPI
jgi:hypothetical protein